MDRICPNCTKPLKALGRSWRKLYCNPKCYREHTGFTGDHRNLPTGTVGAVSELTASIDLLNKGYEVFRALSPHCLCDLIIFKGSKVKRIEVRTAYRNAKGTYSYPRHSRSKDVELFCLVVGGSRPEVVYIDRRTNAIIKL